MAMTGDEVRRLMLGWARPELLANVGVNPVRDLKRAYRTHRQLLKSPNDLVALKAVELYDKRYGTQAPQAELDRTPRFAVQINLAGADNTHYPKPQSIQHVSVQASSTQALDHNGLGLPAVAPPQIDPTPPPPKLAQTRRAQGGSPHKKPSHEPALSADTPSPIVAGRTRRCSKCQGEGHYAKTCGK